MKICERCISKPRGLLLLERLVAVTAKKNHITMAGERVRDGENIAFPRLP